MVDKDMLSKDFEEQIQSLAGDIYIQVEEKVSSMVTSLVASQELTDEKVEQHTHYISLKESQQKIQTEIEQVKSSSEQQIKNAQKEKDQLNEKLVVSAAEINNLKEVNGSKQSDSEVLLKEKLDEISALNIKLEAFIKQEPVTIDRIATAEKQIQELTENKIKLEQSATTLIKSDSAKVVALDLQSKQISELQLQVNNANSELEQLQLEQSKLLETKASDLGEEKKQITELNGKVLQLNEQLKISTEKQKQVGESEEHHKKQLVGLNDKIVQLTEQLNVSAEKQKQASDSADEQQQVKIQALNKEQDALIAIIATHKEKELANEEAIKKSSSEAGNTKQQIEKLTAELVAEKQKIDEQVKQLQTLKQENSDQGENQLVTTDKITALESANSELQKQRDSLQDEQQKSNDKLQIVAKDYQDKISKLNDKQLVDEKRFITDSQILKDSQVALENEKQTLQAQLGELQTKVDSSEADLVNKQSSADQHQEVLASLEEQLKEAKSEHDNTQQRIDNAKAKFDSDSDQARETIKYLRDENHEITTKYEQRVGELEDKLTEFRLRFEYAQRQLAKNED